MDSPGPNSTIFHGKHRFFLQTRRDLTEPLEDEGLCRQRDSNSAPLITNQAETLPTLHNQSLAALATAHLSLTRAQFGHSIWVGRKVRTHFPFARIAPTSAPEGSDPRPPQRYFAPAGHGSRCRRSDCTTRAGDWRQSRLLNALLDISKLSNAIPEPTLNICVLRARSEKSVTAATLTGCVASPCR
jgi:hypothetical protein